MVTLTVAPRQDFSCTAVSSGRRQSPRQGPANDASKDQVCVLFLQIEVDKKYQKQICGLCGNFDGEPNDLEADGKRADSRARPGAAAATTSQRRRSYVETMASSAAVKPLWCRRYCFVLQGSC